MSSKHQRGHDDGQDLKITAPTFARRINPRAYLDWEEECITSKDQSHCLEHLVEEDIAGTSGIDKYLR